ncbi:PLP-dependent aminotransferase family protein [Celerinatantimonas sp. YJH-8]|uniref:aminotransferase-like domain-containing protein n=1 Tax=Celerinatantimonas sp. YJH-8 TaxID=3228714 RepID=UPI0038CB2C1E
MTISRIEVEKHSPQALYKQIADQLAQQIEQGLLHPNEKLPTHRALADILRVTVGTITRAYAEAERRGLIEARVGAGTYVVDKQKGYWEFEYTTGDPQQECHFGYNMPPLIDQSDYFKKAMQALSDTTFSLDQFLTYQQPVGIESHRRIVAQWLQQQGRAIQPERMLFTSGVQHGIQMVLDTFTDVGDTILTEKLTYPGLFSLARHKKLTLRGVEMDDDGILPESLDAACQHYHPRLIYLIPTLQNPTTAIMPRSRRLEVIAICKKHDVLIIEDDVSGLLPDHPPEPFLNLAPEQVIHLGAFSKCCAPGLRVGYIQSPARLYARLEIALKNHSWMMSPLLSALVCELICSGSMDQIVANIRHEIAKRSQMVLDTLQPFTPHYHPNGLHFWLPLPDSWRLSDFVQAAQEQNVIVSSAENFTLPAGHVLPAIRISIGSVNDPEQMLSGIRCLKQLLSTPPIGDFNV